MDIPWICEPRQDYNALNDKHDRRAQEKLKLDQIMKVLFNLSNKVIVDLMNALFNENFTCDEVTIDYSNGEFINDDYERISGDMYITIRKKERIYRYHIEFQTLNDQSMAIRMFRYGFEKAVEIADPGCKEEIRLEYPRQLVIFLEENENISDQLSFILELPDGNTIRYAVPVVKYWKFTAQDLKDKRMYALLPLQVFKSRKRIQTIYNGSMPETRKGQLINEEFEKLIGTISVTMNILEELHESKEIYVSDLEKILRVIKNITEYLYNKYGEYKKVDEEVMEMVTTLYNPIIKEEGKIEDRIEAILELLEDYGCISEDLRKKIGNETNLVTLKKWHKLAARVSSIDEFVERMASC